MNNQPLPIEPLSVEAVRHLSLDQWNKCVEDAKTAVKLSVPEPELKQFNRQGEAELPPVVSNSLVACLFLLGLGALFISAGKQLIVANLAFGDLLKVTDILSPYWLFATLIVSLMVGELGSLLFALAASLFPAGRIIFRAFSIGCASIALIANITVTALHPVEGVVWFQWFTTVLFPLMILGIGYMGEIILVKRIETHRENVKKFNIAHDKWNGVQNAPDSHSTYKGQLKRIVLEALRLAQPTKNWRAWDVSFNDPSFRRLVYNLEYFRQAIDTDTEPDRPTQPLPTTQPAEEKIDPSSEQASGRLGFSAMTGSQH